MVCILLSGFGFTPRYLALHATENGFFLNCPPPLRYRLLLIMVTASEDIKLQSEGEPVYKGDNILTYFPCSVGCYVKLNSDKIIRIIFKRMLLSYNSAIL